MIEVILIICVFIFIFLIFLCLNFINHRERMEGFLSELIVLQKEKFDLPIEEKSWENKYERDLNLFQRRLRQNSGLKDLNS